jgi:RNA polymerase-interacting CarD/CdnL/TRCF family regulator
MRFLAFRKRLKNIQKREVCEKTKYYYNFSVEEYEMLMYLLERQYDVFGILRDYYNSKALRPFSNYLQERYEDIGMTDFMEDLYDKASKRMKELAFPCG